MVQTPLEPIKRFSGELQTVNVPAYFESPLKEKDAVRKTAVVVLLAVWLNGKPQKSLECMVLQRGEISHYD